MRDKDVKHKPYRSIIKSVQSIVKAEGWRGLQKGLSAQTAFQFTMNSVRLGIYQTLDDYGFLKRDENGKLSTLRCIAVGGISGFAGVSVSCPFYMIKTQLQAQSKSTSTKYVVGYQHQHRGLIDALKTIYSANGLRGLWKGYSAIVPRNCVGSSVQLSTFSTCKDYLSRYDAFRNSIFYSALVSSLLTGLVTCVFMTPFDTAATRMFNQPTENGRGLYYRNIFDVFVKVSKTEGFFHGFYKGFAPNYFRMAPQHLLNLTFWEKFKEMNRKFQNR
jgi:solute carrier family 25, member 34/35